MFRILAALVFLILPAAAQSVVVLPFINLTKNQSMNWIGESVADSIQEALGAEGILVLDRDVRVQAYRRLNVRPYVQITKATMVKIGDELVLTSTTKAIHMISKGNVRAMTTITMPDSAVARSARRCRFSVGELASRRRRTLAVMVLLSA